jgi:Arc/MetJ-type ribon-helix-helix transcriptional regulator
MTTTRKNTRSISFTQAADDKALAAAIEQALAEQRYASFDELGKAALRQFLSTSEPAQTTPGAEQPTQQFLNLQQQLDRLEQALTTKDAPPPSHLEEQLVQLTQQIGQLGDQVTQPLAEVQRQVTRLEGVLAAIQTSQASELADQLSRLAQQIDRLEASGQPVTTSEPDEPAIVQQRELDPVLQRLSALLENF